MFDLCEFKTYLRIDADQTETDPEIERLISAAISIVERRTNHILKKRQIAYQPTDGKARIYDYPFYNVPEGVSAVWTRFYADCYSDGPFVLTIGHDETTMPEALREAVFQIVEHWFYGAEKSVTPTLPPAAEEIINQYRRFI